MSKIKITFLMIAAIMLTFVGCKKDEPAPSPVPEQNTVDNPDSQPPFDGSDTGTDEPGDTPDEPVTPPATTNTFTVGDVTFTMISVQGGTFLMGAQDTDESSLNYDADANDREQPVHRVTLSDYAIGETEVTQSLWQAVMGTNPSSSQNGNNYPVESVSWDDICGTNGFLDKLNAQLSSQLGGRRFVLPTEAQWEFAAAGGQASYNSDGSRKHKYSGSDNIEDVAWYSSNSDNTTHSVKGKAANELGLYDMSGNVFEWCSDWYGSYSADDQTDPTGASSGSGRVLRGGSWRYVAVNSRVAYRADYDPSHRNTLIGFRLALVQD